MTLYEKLLLLTYYNPRIKMYKYDRVKIGKKLPPLFTKRLPHYQIYIMTKTNNYVFIDTLNILTEKDFKQLVKCL
jgi:hypothetical protein